MAGIEWRALIVIVVLVMVVLAGGSVRVRAVALDYG
jgi:hypothetical protein